MWHPVRPFRTLRDSRCVSPEVTFERPDGESVPKGHYIWNDEPELDGERNFYQQLVPTEPALTESVGTSLPGE